MSRSDGRDRREYYRQYYQQNKERLAEQRRARGSTYRKGEHFKARYVAYLKEHGHEQGKPEVAE